MRWSDVYIKAAATSLGTPEETAAAVADGRYDARFRAAHGYLSVSVAAADVSAVDLAADADVFLCEASWTHSPSERPPDLHLSGIEAGEAATKANARALAITHIAPWTDSAEILAEARSTFSGPVDLVRQGQVIELA